jgi:diketogulonate reductase-like aldo/keto reductase
MASHPRIAPVINQIEVHPFNTQTGIRNTCQKHGIAIEAYAPLVRGMRMGHPRIRELATKYACTPAQILVRWSIQHGMITLLKSVRRERLLENASVESIEISEEDMRLLDGLDERLVTDWYVGPWRGRVFGMIMLTFQGPYGDCVRELYGAHIFSD